VVRRRVRAVKERRFGMMVVAERKARDGTEVGVVWMIGYEWSVVTNDSMAWNRKAGIVPEAEKGRLTPTNGEKFKYQIPQRIPQSQRLSLESCWRSTSFWLLARNGAKPNSAFRPPLSRKQIKLGCEVNYKEPQEQRTREELKRFLVLKLFAYMNHWSDVDLRRTDYARFIYPGRSSRTHAKAALDKIDEFPGQLGFRRRYCIAEIKEHERHGYVQVGFQTVWKSWECRAVGFETEVARPLTTN
jgi:hypothetical protein